MLDFLFSNYLWYRKYKGGTWHKNRYWMEAGTVCFVMWERHGYEAQGGPECTLSTHTY